MSLNFDTLFDPRSVAIIGASSQKEKVGYALMHNLVSGGARDLYPITLSEQEVLGYHAHRSIVDVHGEVDLAIIAIRADLVVQAILECAQKGVRTVIVISAGFKEAGDKGRMMEQEIGRVAREHNISLLGPNCLGVINAHSDLNASFSVQKPFLGKVAFLSQSGAIGTALLDRANKEGVGISKFVSLGNEADLNELPFLEYLADDAETDAVLMYLEKVSDGPLFLEYAKKVTAKKPLVVLRAGRSERGSAAVMSHTGSLAPSDAIFSAACAQSGVITVDSFRDLFSFAKLFHMGFTRPTTRLAIVTNGGGPSVNAADEIDLSRSLELATLSEETKRALRETLPPMAAVGNPVDVIGDAGAARYDVTLDILGGKEEIDAILVLVTPQMMTDPASIARSFVTHRAKKPLIPVFMGGASVEPGVKILQESGLTNFDFPSDAIAALDLLSRGKKKTPQQKNVQVDHAGASLKMTSFETMATTLSSHGVAISGVFMRGKNEINDALWSIGEGPFVLKAIGADLVHKSDLKALELGLENAADVGAAWDAIEARIEKNMPGAKIDGMLVQRMEKGKEVIIGMKRDAVFGPVIVFGLGGIFVEILKDVSMRVAPIDRAEARRQMEEIKGFSILSGARGEAAVNLDALAEILANLSLLAVEHPEIEEVDLNPVIATPEKAVVVDARFMVE